MGNKRRTILLNVLIVVLCIAMCVGATFAFFTSSVISSNNKVKSGRLNVDLQVLTKGTEDDWVSIKKDKDPIFGKDLLWEPGYTAVKILRVVNSGDLAIKWEARYTSENEVTDLAKVIDVYLLRSETPIQYPTQRADLASWDDWNDPVGTLDQFINNISDILKGELAGTEDANNPNCAYFGIALKMQESAGNEYQGDVLGEFDIQIVATQLTSEQDFFGNDYDEDATFPCNHTVTETIPGTPATCVSAGLTNGKKCATCKVMLVEHEIIPTSGHTESDWIIDVYPTYTSEGHKYTECTVCHERMQEATIDALPYSEGLEYKISDDGTYYSVVGMGTYSGTDVIIPDVHAEDGINYLPVKVVGDGTNPFKDGTSVTSASITRVSIPYSITTISKNAFKNCTSLASVTFGDGSQTVSTYSLRGSNTGSQLESIGNYAFDGCTALENITIPDSVTYIDGYAFRNCTSLESITFGENSQLTGTGVRVFYNCTGLKAVYISNLSAWCRINFDATNNSNGYSRLSNPLYYAHNLYLNGELITELVIPDDITKLERYAFQGCTPLTSVVVHNNVTNIRNDVFNGCSNIESMILPFVGAFAKTTTDTYQYPLGIIFGTTSYEDGVETTQYYFGSSTSSSTFSTFYIPSSLKSVTVTGGNILCYAFFNCKMIENITLPENITSIEARAFYGCKSLESIVIPSSVKTINTHVFSGCSSLKTVTFGPNSQLESINGTFGGSSALDIYVYDWKNWINVSFESEFSAPNYTGFGSSGRTLHFLDENGNEITDLVIPEGVTHIGNYTFHNAKNVKHLTVPDSVVSIGDSAFSGLSSLESITLPFAGTEMTDTFEDSFGRLFGMYPYENDVLVTQYYIMGDDSLSTLSYYFPANLKSVTITGGNILKYTFYNWTNLTSITLSANTTSIGYLAFGDCSGLTNIIFEGTVEQWNAISFGTNWNYNTGEYTIYCTDGKIAKDGTVTLNQTQ